MKVIIAGGRDFTDRELLIAALEDFDTDYGGIAEVVSGGARGADMQGEWWADLTGLPCTKFPAKWKEFGVSAGYRRNVEMAEYADGLLAFWDGESKGTKHMIDIAMKQNLAIRVVRYSK